MKAEERTYRAAIYAGFTEILVAIFLNVINVANYLWNNYHIFGYLGLSLIFYGVWHKYLYWLSKK